MANLHHKPKGPGGGQFSGGGDSGGGSGQTSTGSQSHIVGVGAQARTINTVKERQAMRAMVDKRKFAQNRTSIRNLPTTPSLATRMARLQVNADHSGLPAHAHGIDNATAGKNLAEVSAMGSVGTFKPGG